MMRFFNPNARFFAWAEANLRRGMTFDAGAGDGFVTGQLARLGCTVLGLDPYGRVGRYVMARDATTYPYPAGATTVMLCRPCHGGFAASVINQAEACGVERVLYVGLARNVERDLGGLATRFVLKETAVGEDGENIWEWCMHRTSRDDLNVALLKYHDNAYYWVADRGDYWENWAGGRLPKGRRDDVRARQTIENSREGWRALDWTQTGYASRPDAEYGWLAPDGTFYGCDYQGHASLAEFILKRDVSELENEKYVRVDGPGALGRNSFRVDGEITDAQRSWLLARGHDLDPYGIGKEDLRLLQDEADQDRFERACEEALSRGIDLLTPSRRPRTGD